MRVRQYAYLSLKSDDLTPDQITEIMGVPADEVKHKGSRTPGPPPVPRCHLWELRSGLPDDRPLQDHFDVLLLKIATVGERIAEFLRRSDDGTAVLQVVRNFEDGEEDFDVTTWGIEGMPFKRLGGQHPFLGLHLDMQQLRLLVSLELEVSFDEYG